MSRYKRFWRVAIIVIDVVVAGMLVWAYRSYGRDRSAKYSEMREQSDAMTELQDKKRSLEKELESLEGDFEEISRGSSYISPVFFNLDQGVIQEAVNLFRNYTWTGTIALSAKEFPGLDGKISTQQFFNYCNEGWKYCVAWDGRTDLSIYIQTMKEQMNQAGINWPNAMYFPDGSYKADYDNLLISEGISIIVHHGEGDLTIPTTGVSGDKLEKIAGVDWYSAALDSAMLTVETGGGIMTMDVRNYYPTVEENANDIKSFFGFIGRDLANYPSTYMINLPNAVDALLTEQVRKPKELSEYRQKKADLEDELAATVAEIHSLYER